MSNPDTTDAVLRREKDALQRVAAILGGQAAVASACGFTDRRHVWPWFNTPRRVPAEHCPALERATRAKGQPVRCEELREDVAWEVLRDQATPEAATTGG
jgi:DNA-binding transcriptional regulator YdaS (Cro superfamily)